MRAIEERLYDIDDSFEGGITPLVNFFVAARNLRQKGDTVSYYHPRVEAGIVKALNAEFLPVRRTLSRLVDILIDLPLTDDETGTAVAAEIVGAAKELSDLAFTPSKTAQLAIDAWLSTALAIPGRDLKPKLNLAAAIGSTASVEGEIACWILHRPRRKSSAFMMDWGPPQRDAEWYARMRAAPATKPLIERFLREDLPFDRDHYSRKLAKEFGKLASDLTPAFIDAAREAVHLGVLRSSDAISVGALCDIDAFEPVLDIAVDIDTPSPEDEAKSAVDRLAVENGEYSDAYIESCADHEDGYTAREFIGDYVRTVRRNRGWATLWTQWLEARLVGAVGVGRIDVLIEGYFGFAAAHPNLWSAIYEHRLPDGMELPERLAEERGQLMQVVSREVRAILPQEKQDGADRLARSLVATVHGHCSFALGGSFALMGETNPLELARDRVTEILAANGRIGGPS